MIDKQPNPSWLFNPSVVATSLRNNDECPVCFRRAIRSVRSYEGPDEIWCSHCHCGFYDESFHWAMSDEGIRDARCNYWIVNPILKPLRWLRSKLEERDNHDIDDILF